MLGWDPAPVVRVVTKAPRVGLFATLFASSVMSGVLLRFLSFVVLLHQLFVALGQWVVGVAFGLCRGDERVCEVVVPLPRTV